ncbi:MAG: hypothetical protein P8R36_07085 [Actinomycetota bacterium]|nr:hypothetical protein [Actinomycetota bacterium]MDG1490037.1 hypothetical protein [Actinomycetota bacterium]MDG2120916.1 hypothetical protein [Actinomycetota bacterium]
MSVDIPRKGKNLSGYIIHEIDDITVLVDPFLNSQFGELVVIVKGLAGRKIVAVFDAKSGEIK